MIKIAPFDIVHLDAVGAIEVVTFPTPWTLGAFITELGSVYSDWFVALDDGVVVGYAGLKQIAEIGHLLNLAVRADMRRRGIGRALLIRVLEAAGERGLEAVTLEVRPSNVEAQDLYRSMGFETVGLRRAYYTDTGEDAVIMTLTLSGEAVRRDGGQADPCYRDVVRRDRRRGGR